MTVKLVKYYKWVQTESVTIPVHESDDIEINQFVTPYHPIHRSWYDRMNKEFSSIEEAEAALVQWCVTRNTTWQTFILQTCYRVEK